MCLFTYIYNLKTKVEYFFIICGLNGNFSEKHKYLILRSNWWCYLVRLRKYRHVRGSMSLMLGLPIHLHIFNSKMFLSKGRTRTKIGIEAEERANQGLAHLGIHHKCRHQTQHCGCGQEALAEKCGGSLGVLVRNQPM